MSRPGPLRIETVRGEPYEIDGRTLIPVVRIVAWGKAKATVGTKRVGGWGSGFVSIRPLAMVEERAAGERRIAITDATSEAVGRLLCAALAITLFLGTIRWLVKRSRTSRLAGSGHQQHE